MINRLAICSCVAAALLLLQLTACRYDSAHTASRNYSLTETAVDPPQEADTFEDSVSGGQLFRLYCSSCHNGRPLGERNFRATEVSFSHMRTQAYLTGEEYRKLIHFLRRWSDLGPPIPPGEASPKRFFYEQPIMELMPEKNGSELAEPLPPVEGTTD